VGLVTRTNYRSKFLKSEKWRSIRAASLVYWNSTCLLCLKQDFHNDIHHVWYPKSWARTKAHHTRVLCRDCHKLVHIALKMDTFKLDPGKKKTEKLCYRQFSRIADAILHALGPSESIRDRYDRLSEARKVLDYKTAPREEL